jgi:hypothetical protein
MIALEILVSASSVDSLRAIRAATTQLLVLLLSEGAAAATFGVHGTAAAIGGDV